MEILLINGPNLNLLGNRENSIYGNETLEDIEKKLSGVCKENDVSFASFQSNAEHEIVEKIHMAKEDNVSMILMNPGAFTHTSISIRDALIGVGIPFYEIHISNIFAREEFRHKSYFSDISEGVVCGMGTKGYEFALEKAINSN
jgi:3-dehydroquinate dehydratase-2